MPILLRCLNQRIICSHGKNMILKINFETVMLIVLLIVYIPALVINRLYQYTYPSNFYLQYCTVLKSLNMLCTVCKNIEYLVKLITALHVLYIYYFIESFIQLSSNYDTEQKNVICMEIYYLFGCLYYNNLILCRCDELKIYFHYLKFNYEPEIEEETVTPPQIIIKGDIHTCAICLSDFTDSKTIITKCGHKFHFKCYNDLKHNRHTLCPICKTSLYI